jgi:cellulose synthase/poly-beta-1,6-N-acetylglucosamine synthase-like glycosyltransferase
MAQYDNLRVINMKNKDREGKKQALQEGIKNAKYEWLVFTDADCYPKSDQWLRALAAKCSDKTDIILGYSPYQQGKGYLNDFIRYETLMTAVIYGTFTQLGMPYMGVGRNMAYRKSKFLEKVDKDKFEKISFGDDDIAVNAMASSQNTALQFTEKARVMSLAKATLPDFIKQKTRHISSSAYYKQNHQWLLILLAISQAIFYPFLFFLLFYNPQAAIYLFLFRMTIFLPNLILLMRKMECKDLMHKAILMDFLFFLYYWFVSFRWIQTKKISWN